MVEFDEVLKLEVETAIVGRLVEVLTDWNDGPEDERTAGLLLTLVAGVKLSSDGIHTLRRAATSTRLSVTKASEMIMNRIIDQLQEEVEKFKSLEPIDGDKPQDGD